jgi:hypothetical protein
MSQNTAEYRTLALGNRTPVSALSGPLNLGTARLDTHLLPWRQVDTSRVWNRTTAREPLHDSHRYNIHGRPYRFVQVAGYEPGCLPYECMIVNIPFFHS